MESLESLPDHLNFKVDGESIPQDFDLNGQSTRVAAISPDIAFYVNQENLLNN